MNILKTTTGTLLFLCLLTTPKAQASESTEPKNSKNTWVEQTFTVIRQQAQEMFAKVKATSRLPRSLEKGMVAPTDWTSGFFPGTLWYLYEYTGDSLWKARATEATALLKQEQFNAFDHDLGFKMYCSYGNGLRLTQDKIYQRIVIRSARTLTSRYSYKTGLIMSWEEDDARDWQFPVIIDNMMNLELLMEAYKLCGDTLLRHIACSHADKTMKHHYRKDYSCPHVVDYDAETGKVRKFDWNNGSCHVENSTWSRGQGWGLYGFTMMYRETKEKRYLQQAEHIARFLLNHPNQTEDLIPYWDYSGVKISTVRDASAAALMASAFLELSTYSPKGKLYFQAGEKILKNLSSAHYLARPSEHGGFILKHATGNYLRNSEVDGGLSYADYYFVEALLRYTRLATGKSLF